MLGAFFFLEIRDIFTRGILTRYEKMAINTILALHRSDYGYIGCMSVCLFLTLLVLE